jgi:hypothetical protein
MPAYLDGLIEDGIEEEVSLEISVGQVDGQTDGAAREGVGGDERVGNGGFLKIS